MFLLILILILEASGLGGAGSPVIGRPRASSRGQHRRTASLDNPTNINSRVPQRSPAQAFPMYPFNQPPRHVLGHSHGDGKLALYEPRVQIAEQGWPGRAIAADPHDAVRCRASFLPSENGHRRVRYRDSSLT